MQQTIVLEGRISKVLPMKTGISRSTGSGWAAQDYIFEYFNTPLSRYLSRIMFTVFGADKIKDWNLGELEEGITVTLDCNVQEYNGRYYNSIRCIDVKRKEKNADAEVAAEDNEQETTLATQEEKQPEENVDDLPF